MANLPFIFSAAPLGSGGTSESMSNQRKRTKSGGDISSDMEALRVEDLDSSLQSSSFLKPSMSYASTLVNPPLSETFEFSDNDCSYSVGRHGQNVSFSEKVHCKLDFEWRCAVVVKLMGKPNSTNTFDFMLRGLRRKWQVKGGWKLIDLPNDYFIVKFNLEEDMQHALCGGPWILAGQTLVVRKWRPDFDPTTEVIGSMALWVRISGLPVKFFKEFTIAKIGRILGDVVRVDPVTIGQARGKFARVCIEVDLSKPLRPFVEVEGVAYQVVYEGISMICFECGCFGHPKDKCPSLVKVPESSDQPQNHSAPIQPVEDIVEESTSTAEPSESSQMMDASSVADIVKEDMGPWMLMNYRNKKKGNVSVDNKKTGPTGSRFSVLQQDTVEESDYVFEPVKAAAAAPPIVKLWSSFQDKQKKGQATPKSKQAASSVAASKHDAPTGNSPRKVSTSLNIKPAAVNNSGSSRIPMKDLSNLTSKNNSKVELQYQRKDKGSSSTNSKQSSHVSKKLSFENVSSYVPVFGASAMSGHKPPEEPPNTVCADLHVPNGSSEFVDETFNANSMMTCEVDLPSVVEGMVVT